MLTFTLVAIIFTVIVAGLFLYYRSVEAAKTKIQQLENALMDKEMEKNRLQARLDACTRTVKDLEQQLDESEHARLDLANKLRGKD